MEGRMYIHEKEHVLCSRVGTPLPSPKQPRLTPYMYFLPDLPRNTTEIGHNAWCCYTLMADTQAVICNIRFHVGCKAGIHDKEVVMCGGLGTPPFSQISEPAPPLLNKEGGECTSSSSSEEVKEVLPPSPCIRKRRSGERHARC